VDAGQQPPAKYLNSPETPIFQKGSTLYGLHQARAQIARQKLAFVVEGFMDVVMLAQHGICNAVAAMGTSLTTQQLSLLLRFADRICFVFDGDAAGQQAASRAMQTALPVLESHQAIRFLTLPDNKDPDEFVRSDGPEKFLARAETAPTLGQFMLRWLLARYSQGGKLTSPEARAQFGAALDELLAQMKATNRLRDIIRQDAAALLNQTGQRQPRAHGPPDLVRSVPVHEERSLWSRIYDAASIAPDAASAVADEVVPLLDLGNSEEARLAGLFEMIATGHRGEPSAGSTADRQVAEDLLGAARRLIERQRVKEVRQALVEMRSRGEIDESQYAQQMLALGS
jgi:DNA primase